jgi:hypothetical protein
MEMFYSQDVLTVPHSNPDKGHAAASGASETVYSQGCLRSESTFIQEREYTCDTTKKYIVYASGGQDEATSLAIEASIQHGGVDIPAEAYKCPYHGRIFLLKVQNLAPGDKLNGRERMLKEGSGQQSGVVGTDDGKLNITRENCTCRNLLKGVLYMSDEYEHNEGKTTK